MVGTHTPGPGIDPAHREDPLWHLAPWPDPLPPANPGHPRHGTLWTLTLAMRGFEDSHCGLVRVEHTPNTAVSTLTGVPGRHPPQDGRHDNAYRAHTPVSVAAAAAASSISPPATQVSPLQHYAMTVISLTLLTTGHRDGTHTGILHHNKRVASKSPAACKHSFLTPRRRPSPHKGRSFGMSNTAAGVPASYKTFKNIETIHLFYLI